MEDLLEIKLLVSKLKPIETLSVLAFYLGVDREKKCNISESELELIQYLFMTTEMIDSPEVPNAAQIIKLIDYSNSVKDNFLYSRLKDIDSPSYAKIKFSAELARFGVQDYRNWSYVNETIEIIKEMVSPISDYVKKNTGYNLKGFSAIVEHVFSKVVGETLILINSEIGKISDLSDFDLINELIGNENLHNCIKRYCIDIDFLSKKTKIEKKDFIGIVDSLSYQYKNDVLEIEGIYNNNPVSLRPFIKVSEDRYMVFSISAINSFYMEMLANLVECDKKSVGCFNKRRSKYVESKTFEIFKKYFPSCEIYNDYYIDGFDSSQKDVIMKYGDVIYLIEVKSNGIKKGIRDSGIRSLKSFLEDTIVSAHNQSLELKNKIVNGTVVRVAKTKSISFIIEPLKIRKVCRLVVMFRELGGLHTNLRNFEGLIGKLGDDISVMTLTDLMVVFDVLSCQSERLDYLLQRLEIEKELDYSGDEADLLGYYLLNRFDVDYSKYRGRKVLFKGHSSVIDNYKMSVFMNPKSEKPRFNITPFWVALIDSIEHSLGVGARPIISKMYRFNFLDQQNIHRKLKMIFPTIKFKVDMQSYQYIDIVEEKTNVLFRFVVIKLPSLSLFYGDKMELHNINEMNYSEVFILYLNSMNDGKYVGSIALSKKMTNRVNPLIIM